MGPDGFSPPAAGALAAGDDIHSGNYTLAEAKVYSHDGPIRRRNRGGFHEISSGGQHVPTYDMRDTPVTPPSVIRFQHTSRAADIPVCLPRVTPPTFGHSARQAYCNQTAACVGLTVMAAVGDLEPATKYSVYFKSARKMNADANWTSVFKVRRRSSILIKRSYKDMIILYIICEEIFQTSNFKARILAVFTRSHLADSMFP
eukprot:1192351-Prorocentrum_minimum.AAC.2